MNQDKIRDDLISMFNATKGKRLNKRTYMSDIGNLESQYSDLLTQLADALNNSDDNLDVIANVIPDYAIEEISKINSKRKRSLQEVDFNMNMVCYFIPLVGNIKSHKSEETAARIVEIWNEKMPNSKIGVSTAGSIDAGFKKGLCYISTAVCHSLQKPDDCQELTLLRGYRDKYLLNSDEGRKLVAKYYDIAPTIVNKINRDNEASTIYKEIWSNYLEPCINLIQNGRNDECKKLYSEMVVKLEETYL